MSGSGTITWSERGVPGGIEADEATISQLFTLLALGAARSARSVPERAVAAWFAWHDLATYGPAVSTMALEEIPWTGEPDAERAFLVRAVECLAGGWWADLFPVTPSVGELDVMLARLRIGLDGVDLPADPPAEVEAADSSAPGFGRCLLHAVPLHRYGCIVCNQDELYGALSGEQCRLAGRLLSAADPEERSEAARLLAAEVRREPSRITLCALAHVHALAVEREPPGLLRTYLLASIVVCTRRAGEVLELRHVAPIAGVVSVLDGWDAAQAASVLNALECQEPAAPLSDA
jgi:hypothetical protein